MKKSLQDKIEEIKQKSKARIDQDPEKFFCYWALMKHMENTLMDDQGTLDTKIYDRLEKIINGWDKTALSNNIKKILELSPLY